MSDDIKSALNRTAEQLPDLPERLDLVRARVRQSQRRERSMMTGIAGLLVIALAGSAFALVNRGSDDPGGHAVSFNGDGGPAVTGRYRGYGQVVAVPGKVPRLCAPLPVPAIYPAPPVQWCGYGVDAPGVDLDALDRRKEENGTVSGWAQLTGTLQGNVLRVEEQQPTEPAQPSAGEMSPPCPAPAGGWATTNQGRDAFPDAVVAYQTSHPYTIAHFLWERPAGGEVLVVITYSDPAPVREALLESYSENALCVVPSRYTFAEVMAAKTDDDLHISLERKIFMHGMGTAPDGQLQVTASALYLTPALEAAIARHPRGLIHVDTQLTEVPGG